MTAGEESVVHGLLRLSDSDQTLLKESFGNDMQAMANALPDFAVKGRRPDSTGLDAAMHRLIDAVINRYAEPAT